MAPETRNARCYVAITSLMVQLVLWTFPFILRWAEREDETEKSRINNY